MKILEGSCCDRLGYGLFTVLYCNGHWDALCSSNLFSILCYCAVPYGLRYGIALTINLMTMGGREGGGRAGRQASTASCPMQGMILVHSGNALEAQVVRVVGKGRKKKKKGEAICVKAQICRLSSASSLLIYTAQRAAVEVTVPYDFPPLSSFRP